MLYLFTIINIAGHSVQFQVTEKLLQYSRKERGVIRTYRGINLLHAELTKSIER